MGLLHELIHSAPDRTLAHPGLHVPFVARKLSRSSVVWINRRYFLESGVDVLEEAVLSALRDEIDAHFGFAVPQPHEPADAFQVKEQEFFADRYGGFGVSTHAGSGRCGTLGKFQVKGIGRTPLVGMGAEFLHSHGAVTLEEAIREAIFGEVANDELPHGALPVIAIIKTGTNMVWGESKALLVRPNFFRSSCFERVIDHRPCRPDQLFHMADVARVRGIIRQVAEASYTDRARIGVHVDNLKSFMDRSIEQLAFMHTHRLHFGAFTSSNLTINGEVLDYGAARATPNWERFIEEWPSVGLDDIETFTNSCKQLYFHLSKHAAESRFAHAPEDISSYVSTRYRHAFSTEILRLLGISGHELSSETTEAIYTIFYRYFVSQQRIRPCILSSRRSSPVCWIHDVLGSDGNEGQAGEEGSLLQGVRSVLGKAFAHLPDATQRMSRCMTHLRRTSMPRTLLFRERLTSSIYRDVHAHHGEERLPAILAERTEALIRFVRSASRRSFDWIADDFIIHGSVTREDTVAAHCTTEDGRSVICLRAIRKQGIAYFFSRKIKIPELVDSQPEHGSCLSHLTLIFPIASKYAGGATTISVFGCDVDIPALDITY